MPDASGPGGGMLMEVRVISGSVRSYPAHERFCCVSGSSTFEL